MKCRALGPYTFLRYSGKLSLTAVILNHKGKEYNVSIANLLPMHPPAMRLERFKPPPSAASTSSISSISEVEGDGLPPGAVIQPI